ncbi:MAG: phosphopantetheine-binding protein [Clostridia bacterium]|nr:phosphopantetheine-binding protein [Clostridia bacterium]
MKDIICKLLWCQLQSIGMLRKKHSIVKEDKKESGIIDLYDRWLDESVSVLERNHYLTLEGEVCLVQDTLLIDPDSVWAEWEMAKSELVKNKKNVAQLNLVEATMRSLPEILTGKKAATDILFPNSSMELVEGIYKNNPVSDYFNEVLSDSIIAYLRERIEQDPKAEIRILEIGAGTGGTSASNFLKLRPYGGHIQEYCYTDLSKAFLLFAEREYGPVNPFLTYKILNVEEPLNRQGIETGVYDIVVAANVLHATKNIRKTLRNVKAALKANGLLLVNEISENSLFTHLTFGLTEGWWKYEDAELRIPGCPGLYPETWKKIFEQEGFPEVFFPAQKAHSLGQQIIIAESDGVVRQQNTAQAAVNFRKAVDKNMYSSGDTCLKITNKPVQGVNMITGAQMRKNQGAGVSIQLVKDFAKTAVKESIAQSLKMDEDLITDDQSFSEYGVDSIIAVNLVNLVNQRCKTKLETTVLFEYNNVNNLSRYIAEAHESAIVSILNEDNPGSIEVDAGFQGENADQATQTISLIRYGDRETAKALEISKETIAVIGMSGRFAESQTVDDLWKHLANGANLIKEVSRWDLSERYQETQREGKSFCNYGSFLDNIDKFDPVFFNISGIEATYMDPQQRLFLEESWKALENAGYVGDSIQESKCGVYAGCGSGDYQNLFINNPPAQSTWGNHNSVIPARIAYHLNLQGPAIAVDTACSSSLVAIHLACQGLWTRETDMALAGGVFVQSTPGFYLSTNKAGMLSPTGRCSAFDQAADGFVPGEGVGVVVLKRLSEALADGDHIYGVIRGSGINQDGSTNGITAPSAASQEKLICEVYNSFSINPENIQMVEAHGTGTILGDPIEFSALTSAYRKYTQKQGYCALGSIKTNLGHTTAAAGVASLIKVLLSLKNKKIPPSINFRKGNPKIDFDNSPFYVSTSLRDWEAGENSPRSAAISSFGFSGTNAHLVIEEPPEVVRKHQEKAGYLIVLSARTSEQLYKQVQQLISFCDENTGVDCGNISYSLLLGRKFFNHRLACVVRSLNELVKLLTKWLEKGKTPQVYVSNLQENPCRGQIYLEQYGNMCIRNCLNTTDANEYLGNLSVIADLFIQGYLLEFKYLFPLNEYSRIPMPGYPFARDRYWVSDGETKVKDVSPMLLYSPAVPAKQTVMSRLSEPSPVKRTEKTNCISLNSLSDVRNVPEMQPKVNSKQISLQPAARLIPLQSLKAPVSEKPDVRNTSTQPGKVKLTGLLMTSEALQEGLRDSLAGILCIRPEDIDVNKKFIELGMDSIIGVEWIQSINNRYGTSIAVNKAYEHPTIVELAEFLGSEMGNHSGVSQLIKERPAAAEAERNRPSSLIQGAETLREGLRDSLAGILCIRPEDIDVNKKFIELGMDSIIGVEWIQSINNRYGTSIAVNKAYEHPTIVELAEYLQNQIYKPDQDEHNSRETVQEGEAQLEFSQTSSVQEPVQHPDSHAAADMHTSCNSSPEPRSYSLVEEQVMDLISGTIGVEKQKLDMDTSLKDYNIDLFDLAYITERIQAKIGPVIEGDALYQCSTIRDICNLLQTDIKGDEELLKVHDMELASETGEFPELIHLNKNTEGRPVFWIHAGLGGVDVYYPIAEKSNRPFYGIKPHGWYNDQVLIRGIQAIASYYVKIIQSVQPEGPYDLGGYSLGGIFAYEITRQLQAIGQEVSSVVIVEAFDDEGTKKVHVPEYLFRKNTALNVINTALYILCLQEPEKLHKTLINQKEISIDLDDEEYFSQLIKLAKTRGLAQTEERLYKTILKTIDMQDAYKTGDDFILPLPAPDRVQGYLLRNKNRRFLGELQPYFSIREDLLLLDNQNYWKGWKAEIPYLKIIDVDCPNHVAMLLDPKAYKSIVDFCEILYCGSSGVVAGKDFQKKNKAGTKRSSNKEKSKVGLLSKEAD